MSTDIFGMPFFKIFGHGYKQAFAHFWGKGQGALDFLSNGTGRQTKKRVQECPFPLLIMCTSYIIWGWAAAGESVEYLLKMYTKKRVWCQIRKLCVDCAGYIIWRIGVNSWKITRAVLMMVKMKWHRKNSPAVENQSLLLHSNISALSQLKEVRISFYEVICFLYFSVLGPDCLCQLWK